jgi:hypothetical protein
MVGEFVVSRFAAESFFESVAFVGDALGVRQQVVAHPDATHALQRLPEPPPFSPNEKREGGSS